MGKRLFGTHISPACGHCAHGRKTGDEKVILCKRKGVVPASFHCRKYHYDPLQRIPRLQPKLPAHSKEDFEL